MTLKILATPSFIRTAKKLHTKDKVIVDEAVKQIAANPRLGEEKKGDLANVFVYKFKLNKQEMLLAYRLQPSKTHPEDVMLLSLGSHENFYSNLKGLS
jgi:hypothetical protein